MNEATNTKHGGGKVLSGTVVSDKMDKTIVVEVQRYVRHKRYGKFIRLRKRHKAHDPENRCQAGDTVKIRERRRASKEKAFEVINEDV